MNRLLSILLFINTLLPLTSAQITGTYVPIAYSVSKSPECLYERVTASEHLTASVFVVEGSELKALVAIDGPVAPIDIDLQTEKEYSGHELKSALDRYDKEGTKMFGHEVEPIRFAEVIDFESEVEMYDDAPDGGWSEEQVRQMEMEQEEREKRLEMQKREEYVARRDARREHQLEQQVEKEFEYDDDFVKLQMDKKGKKGRRLSEEVDGDRGRRLSEGVLMAGEAFEKTFLVKTPGWYRLCVGAKSDTIEVEMELRKSSTYGKVNPRTGHVPSLEDVEIHSEIHSLFEKEDDAEVLAEEESIKDEDFKTTHEQLRVLERVYHDIIDRQLEERRAWGWRTVHNKHLYSHMVMGNLIETCFYMIITGWQVYTIRKWFSGGPALGK